MFHQLLKHILVQIKKGYLNKFERARAHIKPKPKSAPALVDCTKCETPIAAPANNNPGPNLFINPLIIHQLFFPILF